MQHYACIRLRFCIHIETNIKCYKKLTDPNIDHPKSDKIMLAVLFNGRNSVPVLSKKILLLEL